MSDEGKAVSDFVYSNWQWIITTCIALIALFTIHYKKKIRSKNGKLSTLLIVKL
jgi:hypothetical protein